MDRMGLCVYCNKPGTILSCILCGAHCCPEHFDQTNSVCLLCSRKAQGKEGARQRMRP